MPPEMTPERARSIAGLKFNEKLVIAFNLLKLCWRSYFWLFVLLAGGEGLGIFIANTQGLFGVPLYFLLNLALTFYLLGVKRSLLGFMEDRETGVKREVLFEPWARWPELLIPVTLVLSIYTVADLLVSALGQSPVLLLPAFILAVLLAVVLEVYQFFWAEQTGASFEAHLSVAPKLVFNNLFTWVSATLGAVAAMIPLLFVLIMGTLILAMVGGTANALTPESFSPGIAVMGVLGLLALFVFALLAMTLLFITLLYAIAYKQSMARKYLDENREEFIIQ